MGFLIDTGIWISVERGQLTAADVHVWLAAQAVQRGFKLLTFNEKDFKDIPGLDLVVMKLPEKQK